MKINKEFVIREIAGDYIIVPTGSTALQFNGLITVNEVGAFLWNLLKQETTEEELLQNLVNEYEVDEETAKKDIEEFLEHLKANDIVEMSEK